MLLQVSNLSKSYGVQPILTNISMQVQRKDRIGIVGVNGAGKSTLLRIIAGEYSADSGDIFKAKELTVGYLAQNSGLSSERTIWEEMRLVFAHLLNMENELRELEVRIADPHLHDDEKRYNATLERYARLTDDFREQGGFEINTRINSVLHGMGFAEFAPETPIATLSGGQKTRLALARILLQAPDLLMLDEPTNHLDIETLSWLENYLRGYSGAIVVVSHDRYFLDAMATAIVEIERHCAKRYTGNYSRFLVLKAAEYEANMKQYEKQQDEISRMEQFIQKNLVRASTTKRAQSRRKALDKLDRLDRPGGDLKRASFSFEIERPTGKDVLKADNLAYSFDTEDARPLFQHVTFSLSRGDMVALIGPNGIGKSTLLKLLIAQTTPLTGSIQWGTGVKLGFYDQEQTILNGKNTILEELWSTYPSLEEVRIRTVLGNFLFSGEDVLKRIDSLSGGEKARVALAKLMLLQANVLILDEPTNHLDLFSREVLENALMDYEGTLLFISHDRYFLNKMAERIVELSPEGVEHFLGNYDEMVEKKREMEELRLEALADESSKAKSTNNGRGGSTKQDNDRQQKNNSALSSYELDKQARREERIRQRRLEKLEQDIADLEQQISEFEEQLANPDIFNDYVRIQEIQKDIQDRQQQLTIVYEEWEQLLQE